MIEYATNPIHLNKATLAEYLLVVFCSIVCAVVLVASSKKGREKIAKCFEAFKKHPIAYSLLSIAVLVQCVFASTKPPPVVVEKGILLEAVMRTPHKVGFKWSVEDKRIKEGATFHVQQYSYKYHDWYNIGSTTNHSLTVDRFTIHEDTQFRIISDITDKESEVK